MGVTRLSQSLAMCQSKILDAPKHFEPTHQTPDLLTQPIPLHCWCTHTYTIGWQLEVAWPYSDANWSSSRQTETDAMPSSQDLDDLESDDQRPSFSYSAMEYADRSSNLSESSSGPGSVLSATGRGTFSRGSIAGRDIKAVTTQQSEQESVRDYKGRIRVSILAWCTA